MKCPKCDSLMENYPTDEIVSWRCGSCGGLYTKSFVDIITPKIIQQIKKDHQIIKDHYDGIQFARDNPRIEIKTFDKFAQSQPNKGLIRWMKSA